MELSIDKLRAPDGGYEEGFTVPGSQASPKRVSKPDINLERNNPLSLHTEVRQASFPPFTNSQERPRILGQSGSPLSNSGRQYCRMSNERKCPLSLIRD